MANWIVYDKDWFDLDDFCHIWIEERQFKEQFRYGPLETDYTHRFTVTGYYLMGEWRHNGEEVIISQDWDSLDELKKFVNGKLNVYKGWTRD